MAKKQTRRSVSLSKETYNLLKTKCDKEGVTMSGVVSQLIEDYLSGNLRPAPNNKQAQEEPEEDGVDEAEAPGTARRGGPALSPRFVVNTDLIISGPESEAEAEQVIHA